MLTIVFNATLALAAFFLFRWERKRSLSELLFVLLLGIGFVAGASGILLTRMAGESMFGAMRLWSWAVFLQAPLIFLVVARIRGRDHRWLRIAAPVFALGIAAIGVYAFRIEPHWLEVSRVTIRSDKITKPLRLVLVADIQTDRVGDYERRVLEQVMSEEPDAILFAGDYIQDYPGKRRKQREALARTLEQVGLKAPLGVYAVEGNTDTPGWERVFAHIDAHVFQDKDSITSGELTVTGLAVGQSFAPHLRVKAKPGFHIVLGHSPDFALGDIDADLLLAGHCHGGQVRLPFIGPPLTLARIPRAWTSGMTEIRPGTSLIVSRGVGMERGSAPRLRFLCRPEIVVIDLVPEDR